MAAFAHYTLPANGILQITFTMPTPNTKMARIGLPHTQRPDIDNLVKAFMDSIADEKGDAHIHTIIANKIWGEFGKIEVIEE